jgi:thiosulfate/3-mercaptopyruvate sulfurtransferase
VLGTAGLDPAREIIVYGERGLPSVYFAQLTLRYFGATNARVFHDGIDAWRAAGQPMSTTPVKPKAVTLKLVPQPGVTVESREVVAALKRADVQFVDVRTAKEYKGEDVRAIRGGHIPGAINIAYEQNWVDPATAGKLSRGEAKTRDGMALKPVEDLKKLYARLDPAKETVVYCQSGVRASETANVLRELGFVDVKLYKPSWLGYAAMLDAPAENETFVNVGALNARIADLQSRLDEVEAALRRK